MLKTLAGLVVGVAGAVLLASIVIDAEYLAFASDDFALRMGLSLVGLFMVHQGYRLVTSSRESGGRK
ncbi:hypothetical protein DEALK_18720 [Dehalogenimonas alkenigignens]|uniref:Uncharacterized protein n=1 Tax=Dehalogenimonas alkenigignens TaxID=1217799 RepID=A0A0W0GKD6_9CHLR|nr:hypothetical protein [Dehalogenimonas alkenigignens]KTB49024.1 hypothetical protein DEALK_18720 [Dehalogenimonas alkenigignens]